MKYYGKYSSGNIASETPYESDSKNALIKQMTKLAYANCVGMQPCYWAVWYNDENGRRILVAEGGKGYGGRKWKEIYVR